LFDQPLKAWQVTLFYPVMTLLMPIPERRVTGQRKRLAAGEPLFEALY